MPEPTTEQVVVPDKPIIQKEASVPAKALDTQVEVQEEPRYVFDFLHFAKKLDDIADRLSDVTIGLDALNKEFMKQRTPIDHWENIGKSIEYTLDYMGKQYVYAWCNTAITLVASTGGTVTVALGAWSKLFYPRGTKFTVQNGNDATPNQVLIRNCDFFMG